MTVGTQIPFDRLVRAVDAWCGARGRSDVFGQIAEPGPRGYRPTHFEWRSFVEPMDFRTRMESAAFVVAHAGMGSILSALSLGKSLVILPRREDLGEHRNDHQRATAERVAERPGVFVATDEAELPGLLDDLSDDARGRAAGSLSPFAETRLIEVIGAFIRGEDGERPNER